LGRLDYARIRGSGRLMLYHPHALQQLRRDVRVKYSPTLTPKRQVPTDIKAGGFTQTRVVCSSEPRRNPVKQRKLQGRVTISQSFIHHNSKQRLTIVIDLQRPSLSPFLPSTLGATLIASTTAPRSACTPTLSSLCLLPPWPSSWTSETQAQRLEQRPAYHARPSA
jgi:hypothetical protein